MIFQFRDAEIARLETMHRHLEALVDEATAEGPCPARLDVVVQGRPGAHARDRTNRSRLSC